ATREAAIKTHRGKKQNPAVVEKRAAALRGKPKSAAHIAALSLARRGLVMVRPIGGGPSFKVPANDPRLLSGELVGVTAGRFWVHNPITKVN
ncbi:hypothetical protein ACKI1K_44460, partial [Streptomyces scabiei]|uniref:hypothetical protein n=1 Tax=Streptomyces scabiei TaxID=1930 RepID=UPI0038F5FB72